MDFPRLSKKQYLANGALIAAGVAGVWFGRHPNITPIGKSYDFLAAIEPIVRAAAQGAGAACVLGGIVVLIAKRRRLTLLSLALFALIVGGYVGSSVANAKYPDAQLKGESEELRAQRQHGRAIVELGLELGAAFVPLAAAVSAALRKRSDVATQP